MSEVLKYDNEKWRMSDVPQLALRDIAKVFNYGANKYSKFNYSGNITALRYYDACQRHLHAWMTGEDIDESSNHHIAHAIASLMMLLDGINTGSITDDRNSIYKSIKNEDR